MVQKKPHSVKTHTCDSLLYLIGSLFINEVEPITVYDKMYEELSKNQIINSDFLQEALLIICKDTQRLNRYWPKLKIKIISNIKESKDLSFYKSDQKVEKLLHCFPENECKEIRDAIIEMKKNHFK